MGKETGIAWTDHTVNFWWGCEKVSPACAHCYAEQWDKFTGGKHWGGKAPRRFIKAAASAARKMDAAAKAAGVRRRAFCMSMGDLFEDYAGNVTDHRGRWFWLTPDDEVIVTTVDLMLRTDIPGNGCRPMTIEDVRQRVVWPTIRECRNLDWLLLTKRPENIRRMLPVDLIGAGHIWLGTTVESNAYLPRLDDLTMVPAAVHFVSVEPQLEEIDIRPWLMDRVHCGGCDRWTSRNGRCENCDEPTPYRLRWAITGGESKQGKGHQPAEYDLAWPRSIIRQCREFGAAPFVKQLGSRPFQSPVYEYADQLFPGETLRAAAIQLKHPKGEDPSEWPADLQVQEFPEVAHA